MDGTILSQGSFIVPATIVNRTLVIPSNVDWIEVRNYTRQGTVGGASAFGFEYFWQRGMPAGSALVKYYANGGAVVTGDLITSGGFTLYDPSGQSVGALPLLGNPVATTASTNATRPVVSTGSTAGLAVGSVVRMSNTAQTDVNGVDMVVGAVVANTSFTLLTASNPLATAPGAIGGAGFYRIVNADSLFYPRHRFVVNITQAANAQVSTSVAHGLTPGQSIRFAIPAVSGMIQLNPTPDNNYLMANVVSVVDDYNFTIDINTTAFTAFTWPTIAQQPSSFPQFVPVGEDTALSLVTAASQVPTVGGQQIYGTQSGLLADATTNTGFLGMILGTGANGAISGAAITGPAGSVAADVVYWKVGKSSYGGL
ncbi:MAG TPA: hypothetical protein VL443_06385 [Cyclobacteriaceae bacterium]|jgi:hypothetical protein|nr:hypothetical protein [Cyclobacteriaceae bacterium]